MYISLQPSVPFFRFDSVFDCQLELFDNAYFYKIALRSSLLCKFVFQPVFKMETLEEDMEIAEVNIRDLFTNQIFVVDSLL